MANSTFCIPDRLLAWYDAHARVLPWRLPPGTTPPAGKAEWPYRVWLSEVMLQQTTVAAVVPYFERFVHRWPSVTALAAAGEEEVMAAWAGLGYYARARNLHACAREVAARGGRFPDSEAELRVLPGLGAYTAAAVAAIAFGRRAVVVDANVERVVARLFAVDEPLPLSRPALRALADQITPVARAGDFAQGLMDLGATVCTPRAPRCSLCPLAVACKAHATGDPARLPARLPRAAKPSRAGHAFWIERHGALGREVWLVRRPTSGMLGGMRALPDDGWNARSHGTGTPPGGGEGGGGGWRAAGVVRHVFTHFTLALHVRVGQSTHVGAVDSGAGEWWPVDQLGQAGLPALFAKAARLALAGAGDED